MEKTEEIRPLHDSTDYTRGVYYNKPIRFTKGGIFVVISTEAVLYTDPQAQKPQGFCPVCGGEIYAPEGICLRCQRRWPRLAELSGEYEAAAVLLRNRLQLLRRQLSQTPDPEEAWRLKRRINELTPMLTQMNELAELTAHYYERGYYRSGKYTL